MISSSDSIRHDVVVVGAGLAGLSAAIAAADAGADVALVCKTHPLRSHSGAAQGGINAAIKPDDDWRDHMYDTVKGSAWLADQDAARVLTSEAPAAIRWLENLGAPFSRLEDGAIAQRPFGGQRRNRTCYVADHTGHNLLHVLYEQALRRNVPVYEEFFVTRLVAADGRCAGLVAYDLLGGRLVPFGARAVLLATGGAGRVFGQSSNALINTGDGLALAYEAGAELEDMEFFQTHPTGLLNGILMTEGCRGEGAYLVNAQGERFMENYAPKFMELAPRDLVARAIQTEINEGRGFEGGYVHLDLRHLGEEKIMERLPQIREISMYFAGVDPVKAPIPVRPTVHYTMGGVNADADGRTGLPGLYAAGEAACLSVHGANRLGGNSLLEAVVFGPRAAAAAAGDAPGTPEPGVPASAVRDEEKRIGALLARSDGERPAELREAMEKTMRAAFGVFKSREGMEEGRDEIEALLERSRRQRVEDQGARFNQNLVDALQLASMLQVARMNAVASLERHESRGGHYRTDFPKMDNGNFFHHSVLRRGPDGQPQLGTLPVVVEDIQPEEAVEY